MKQTFLLSALLLVVPLTYATTVSNYYITALEKTKAITTAEMSSDISALTKKIDWVSVNDIAKSLPKTKIVVGFDIDDTMLFSSALFYHGKQKYSPGSLAYLNNQKFWNEASTGDDIYSLPKLSAVKLATMHLKHGDTIYFITARRAPIKGKETLTKTIRNLFPKKYRYQLKKVIFTGSPDKTNQIKANKVKIYYGDADTDIISSMKAGARAIRFLRSAQSINKPLPHAGRYGEAVLINSDY
ncbi:MAG: acid phosphatase AphA [Psychromonas sp.]|nr:acid phosphatase AphA [Psychromonas sp.]